MKHYDQKLKEQVISDYLSGGGTYRHLASKYAISFQLIHQWVCDFKGSSTQTGKRPKKQNIEPDSDLPKEVKQLQGELRQARLYNKLLEALIDIGKEQYGIDLRKKPGTKRS
jgi:transposase-like protein